MGSKHIDPAGETLCTETRDEGAMRITRVVPVGLAVFFVAMGTAAQVVSPGTDQPKVNCDGRVRSTYLLGPDDELEISGPELDELANKPARIDGDGDIQVPLVGRVHVAGLTVERCEQELNKRLSTYIRHPQIAVNVKEMRSQ